VEITLLGTSAGVPTRHRGLAAAAVDPGGGRLWLVDCGEGTQQRLLAAPHLRPSRLERVLLTHLHGDHCLGLPGLLATLGLTGRRAPLSVCGPTGVREWLETTLRVCAIHVPYPLEIDEVEAGGPRGVADGLQLEARALVHRVPSYAWILREVPRRGPVDAARAAELGVPAGPLLGRLAAGESLTLPDGSRVEPEQVVGPPRPGRCVVVCGDSADSRSLVPAARGCDVLVHECTFGVALADRARAAGHSTPEEVAALARALRPGLLVLTHFSARYDGQHAAMDVEALRREVQERCPGQAVVAGYDGLRIEVPPAGRGTAPERVPEATAEEAGSSGQGFS